MGQIHGGTASAQDDAAESKPGDRQPGVRDVVLTHPGLMRHMGADILTGKFIYPNLDTVTRIESALLLSAGLPQEDLQGVCVLACDSPCMHVCISRWSCLSFSGDTHAVHHERTRVWMRGSFPLPWSTTRGCPRTLLGKGG